VSGVGCLEYMRTLDLDAVGAAEVDRCRGVEAEARVTVLVVVPAEEALAERAAILDGAEPAWELWPVLERLEVCF
jgi:hypothetical protein